VGRALRLVAAELNPNTPVSPAAAAAVAAAWSRLPGGRRAARLGAGGPSSSPLAGRAAADWPGGSALFGAYPPPRGGSPTQRARNWARVVAAVAGSHAWRAAAPWSGHAGSRGRRERVGANRGGGSVALTGQTALLVAALVALAARVAVGAAWQRTGGAAARALRRAVLGLRPAMKGLQPAVV